MSPAVIEVKGLIANTLDSRDEAQKLFEYITANYKGHTSFVLNFDGVDFMSRSFADEFHKLNRKWSSENNTTAQIDNANVQIIEILQAVANTQQGRTLNIERQYLSFSKPAQLYEYLQAV